jgi:hypothetical protein
MCGSQQQAIRYHGLAIVRRERHLQASGITLTRRCLLAIPIKQRREGSSYHRGIGVLGPKRLLADSQSALEERLRRGEIALGLDPAEQAAATQPCN